MVKEGEGVEFFLQIHNGRRGLVVKSSHFQNTKHSWALIFLFFLPDVIITIYLIGREVLLDGIFPPYFHPPFFYFNFQFLIFLVIIFYIFFFFFFIQCSLFYF
jgi:hypothetical protein